ncbi:cytochrome P450 [Sordaria brevicollis]|uniref:Cytochrome P450 n=1 Tax=Sordaria brevicollis TaxID=83679 RepID=A0AAE0UGM2_SORBR|nr:cytochrome P450 [Sordaria brevicollis]
MAILTALQELPISSEVVTGALVAALALAYIVNTIVVWRSLSHIPGPWWARLSNWGFFTDALKGVQPVKMREYHDKYGSLIRVGPDTVLTDDPEIVRRITAVRGRYVRSRWYQALRLDPDRDNLSNIVDDNLHTAMRRKVGPGISGKENESLETTVDNAVRSFIKLIETKYLSDSGDLRPMDMGSRAQFFTSDVVSELAFGKSFGNCEADADFKGYVQAVEETIVWSSALCLIPSVTMLLVKWPFKYLFYAEDKALGPVVRVARDAVMARFGPAADKSKDQKRDMLASFIRNGIPVEQAIGESVLQLTAGADTSATCIRAVILHLISNHVAYRRLQAEIDRCLADGTISPTGDIIRDSEGRKMPYLQAVIKESLRVTPPASQPFPKVVPPEGDTIAGHFLPGGIELGYSLMAILRRKDIWGADADVWRPERWLEADPQKLALMNSTVDLVFSHGKWMCLGKNVALMEFNKVFVEIFKRFDISLVDAFKPLESMQPGNFLIKNFWVRITRRESDDAIAKFAVSGKDLGLGEMVL